MDKFQEQALIKFEQVFEQLKVLSDSVDTLSVNQEKMQLDITNIRHSQVRMEQDLNKKITALFDFRDSQLKVNKEYSERLDRLGDKIRNKLETNRRCPNFIEVRASFFFSSQPNLSLSTLLNKSSGKNLPGHSVAAPGISRWSSTSPMSR